MEEALKKQLSPEDYERCTKLGIGLNALLDFFWNNRVIPAFLMLAQQQLQLRDGIVLVPKFSIEYPDVNILCSNGKATISMNSAYVAKDGDRLPVTGNLIVTEEVDALLRLYHGAPNKKLFQEICYYLMANQPGGADYLQQNFGVQFTPMSNGEFSMTFPGNQNQ